MSRHISVVATAAVALLLVAAVVVFEVLNSAFGGPLSASTGPSYRLTAPVADVQGLVTKSLVMVRGVPVGQVSSLERSGDHVDVTLAVDPRKVAVHRDATIRVGHRTLFGEGYVRLDPGKPSSGALPSGSRLTAKAVLPTVRLDDALKAFGPRTRAHIRSLNQTAALVDEDPRARSEFNKTIGGLAGTVSALRTLSGELDGQQSTLSRYVSRSRAVVDELSGREQQIRDLVAAGRASAQAATASVPALRATISGTGDLLAEARRTLLASRPLLAEAQPVIRQTSAAAPDLTRVVAQLRPVARSAGTVVRSLPSFTADSRPVLGKLRAVAPVLLRTFAASEPALRDLNPVLRALADYRREVQGFFSTATGGKVLRANGTATAPTWQDAMTAHPTSHPGEDGPYAWIRFIYDGALGPPASQDLGIGRNPYPRPAQPYAPWSGKYQRVLPDPLPDP